MQFMHLVCIEWLKTKQFLFVDMIRQMKQSYIRLGVHASLGSSGHHKIHAAGKNPSRHKKFGRFAFFRTRHLAYPSLLLLYQRNECRCPGNALWQSPEI